MAATKVETLTQPRDSLPNVYVDVAARELDFVSRFGNTWEELQNVLGISRPIIKEAGTVLKSYIASVTLEDGDVDPGNVIPYSKATIQQVNYADLTLKKYAKAVPVEDVDKYGVTVAVEKSDDAFLDELQGQVLDSFYTAIADDSHAMTATYPTFQMAVAMAIGKVKDKFKKMKKNSTNIVVFVNTLDLYEYLGGANVTIQTAFGLDYIKDFLGASTVIVTSEISKGTVVAIPAENLIAYAIDPSTEFAKLGLVYTTDGVTNLIGFHAQGNYGTAVGESFALMGMKLWMEYADGVAIVTIDANPIKPLTLQSDLAGATYPWTDKTPADFQSGVTVDGDTISGTLLFMEGGLSPDGPLAGDGYFAALKWSDPEAGVTSLKVGLIPSASGMEPVECISDTDRNGVFKISSNSQSLKLIQSKDGHKTTQTFKLNFKFEQGEG